MPLSINEKQAPRRAHIKAELTSMKNNQRKTIKERRKEGRKVETNERVELVKNLHPIGKKTETDKDPQNGEEKIREIGTGKERYRGYLSIIIHVDSSKEKL